MTCPLNSGDVKKLFYGKFVCVIGDSGKYYLYHTFKQPIVLHSV